VRVIRVRLLFAGIPASRLATVEIGKADKELLGTQQSKDEPAGIIVEELGQLAVALTYLFFEDDQLFKIVAVVDPSCQPLDFANASRGGARDVLENWDTLQVSTPTGAFFLRLATALARSTWEPANPGSRMVGG
jgi:hypothetical protein